MVPGVVADRMAGGDLASLALELVGPGAGEEEGGRGAGPLEGVQDRRHPVGVGAGVEGERDQLAGGGQPGQLAALEGRRERLAAPIPADGPGGGEPEIAAEAVVDGEVDPAGAVVVAQQPGAAALDPDGGRPVPVPVAGHRVVGGPAVGERRHGRRVGRVVAGAQVPGRAADDAWGPAAVAVPVPGHREVGAIAVGEADVGHPRARVGVLQEPGAAPDHPGGVGAVAVPVANHRVVTGIAVGEAEIRLSAGQGVAQVPAGAPHHPWGGVSVAVPVAQQLDVPG
jgi:hypothetical protein